MPLIRRMEAMSGDNASIIWRNVLTFLAILGILILLWICVLVKSVLVLLLVSIVFAAGLGPAVVWLENVRLPRGKRFPRGLAILIIFLLGILIALGAVTLVVVPLIREGIEFSKHSGQYIASVKSWLADVHARHPQIPDYAGLVDIGRKQFRGAGRYLGESVATAVGIFGGVISVITVLVITYYLLADFERLKRRFLTLVPPKHETKASRVLSDMAQAMGGWLRGQLLVAGIVGITTGVVMFVIGVPYPFVIAVIGALGELIPVVGVVAAAVTAIFITAFGPLWKLAAAVIYFLIMSQIDSNVLIPRIMQRNVGLSPLVTVLALLTGAAVLGVIGALIAIPIAAALQVFIRDVVITTIRAREGRRPHTPPDEV